MSRSMSEGETL